MTDVLARKAMTDAAVDALFVFDRDHAETHRLTGVPTPARPIRAQPDVALDDSVSLRARRPAAGVVRRTLELQREADSRSGLARLFGIDPLTPDAAEWHQTALDEFAVARALRRLGPEWTVLHSVPLGAARDGAAPTDIDHVVIGPAGVFALNSTHHRGKHVWVAGANFLVDGHGERYLSRALEEREDASTRLSVAVGRRVEVESMVVLVGAESVTLKGRPAAPVVQLDKLVGWLASRPAIWDAVQLAAVVAAADRPSTWRRRADLLVPGDADAVAFAVLEDEVRSARIRRAVWSATGALAISAAAFALVATGLLGG